MTGYVLIIDTDDGPRIVSRTWSVRDAALVARTLANDYQSSIRVHLGDRSAVVEPNVSTNDVIALSLALPSNGESSHV